MPVVEITPLALDRDRLRTRAPHRVDDRLDVLLVHDDVERVAGLVREHLVGGVVEDDLHGRPAAGREAGRVGEVLDLALGPVDAAVAEPGAERLRSRSRGRATSAVSWLVSARSARTTEARSV